MSQDICSSRQCNVCLVDAMEYVPVAYEDADEKAATSLNLKCPDLMKCSGCQLVVYCSERHQKLDWPLHRHLCRAAQKIISAFKIKNPYFLAGQPTNADDMERCILQVKFVLCGLLGRPLYYHEDELTSFPQFCEICYSLRRLRICGRCQAVSYCSEEHALQDQEKHNRQCGLLQLYYCPYKAQSLETSIFEFHSRVPELHKKDLYEAFQQATLKQLPKQPSASFAAYKLFNTAADFSCIGTICYILNFTEMSSYDKSKFVIFIVGAVFEQQLWFQDIHQQFFFLQFPQITELHLYFIGPQAEGPDTHKYEYEFKGQERCVHTFTYQVPFEEFSRVHDIKPSLIIAFNCGFSEHMGEQQKQFNNTLQSRMKMLDLKVNGVTEKNGDDSNENSAEIAEDSEKSKNSKNENGDVLPPSNQDTWAPAILEMLMTFDVPIAFTSYNSLEAQFDYATLLRIAQTEDPPIAISRILNVKKNPFHDLRPLRHWRLSDDYDDGGIFYRNGYVQAIRTRFAT